MNIVQKLTTAHLKANVRRTVTTILGIVISVAMITAVFVSVSSLFKYFGDAAISVSYTHLTLPTKLEV